MSIEDLFNKEQQQVSPSTDNNMRHSIDSIIEGKEKSGDKTTLFYYAGTIKGLKETLNNLNQYNGQQFSDNQFTRFN